MSLFGIENELKEMNRILQRILRALERPDPRNDLYQSPYCNTCGKAMVMKNHKWICLNYDCRSEAK